MMKKLIFAVFAMLSFGAIAQDAGQYVRQKAAGKAPTLSVPTKVDPQDINKTVADVGYVLMATPTFDSATGASAGSQTIRVQIASKIAERAALAKQLADLDVLIADLQAAK